MTEKVDEQQQAVEEEVVDIFNVKEGQPDPLAGEPEASAEPTQEAGSDAPAPEEEIPEKYKGKSLNEIIRMHQEAEKAMGRQGNEMGELRRLTDEILKQQLDNAAAPARQGKAEPSVSADDLMENPDEAISKVVSSDPKVQEIEARLNARERAEQHAASKAAHPDSDDVVRSDGFRQWILASPVRTQMFQDAHVNYNYESAHELLSLYKDLQALTTADRQQVEQQREKDKAVLGAPRSSGASEKPKQVFKRADLMRLRIEDPARYERMQPQIMAAYREGRVR